MALVDANSVPEMPADPAALLAAAAAMAPAAASVGERTTDAATRWSTLGDAFDTPDTSTAVGRAQPLVAIADDFESAASAVADAMSTLGETLAALAWTQTQLAAEVDAHVAEVARYQAIEAGQDEAARGILDGMGLSGWTRNESLRQRCSQLRAQFQAALMACEQNLKRIGDPAVALPAGAPAASSSLGERAAALADTVSMSVLHRLASAPPGDVEKLLSEHPDWSALVRDHPPAPNVVVEWWKSLDAATIAALISGASSLIGNLEGVSYVSRDQANRKTLEREIAKLRAELEAIEGRPAPAWEPGYGVGGGSRAKIELVMQRLENLLNIENALLSPPDAPRRSLVSISDSWPPLAAVAIDDLDSADRVSFAVPGMGTTTRDMVGWTTVAQRLYDQQNLEDPGSRRAVVAWIGYETPPVPVLQGGFDVMDDERAQVGAQKLSRALAGVKSTVTPSAGLDVVGHSYGTTTASLALTLPETPRVHTFVSVGSAGLHPAIDSAEDVNAEHVYAGQARNTLPLISPQAGDQWAWTGRMSDSHPVDPSAAEFGAQVFGTDGDNGMYPVTDHSALMPSEDGWGYFDRGTESLQNIARATTQTGEITRPQHTSDGNPLRSYWEEVIQNPGFSL